MNGVMIALLPISSEWSKIDMPHMTLVYSGTTEDHPITDMAKMIKDASSISLLTRSVTTRVVGLDVFGPEDERVDVLTLMNTPEIMAMRNMVEKWDRSEYPVFKPHVTIGPSPSFIIDTPRMVAFNRVVCAWGESKFIFNMGGATF